jgi:hypothetical protein
MAQGLPPSPIDAGRAFLLLAIGAGIIGVLVLYGAVSNELTGTTTIFIPGSSKGLSAKTVTRQESPTQFRHGLNFHWGFCVICFTVTVVSFKLYRKLDDCT